MKTEIENAIKLLAQKITGDVMPDVAMKYTQAALNLAHTAATISNMERDSK